MKINKHIFIGVLLVLIMIGVIGTVSAADSLDNNLTVQNTVDDSVSVDASESGENTISSTDKGLLGEGETTIYVDGSYTGDEQGTEDNPYKTISGAVSNANGGETIFIINGEYTLDAKISLTKSLNFVGESRDGVIIKSSVATGVFDSTASGITLSFKNLNFKDINTGTGGNLPLRFGGTLDVYITDCSFIDCESKFGIIQAYNAGTTTIDNCRIENFKCKASGGTGGIYFSGSNEGTYTVKNTIINNSQFTVSSDYAYMYGIVYANTKFAEINLDNVTISNCEGAACSVIYARSKVTVTNSKIINNTVKKTPAATYGDSVFYSNYNTNNNPNAELILDQCVIVNNSGPNNFIYANANAGITMNYCNVQDNSWATFASSTGNKNVDANYWGSNDLPTGVTANNWVIENEGVYTLNNGDSLPEGKAIPSIDEPGDEPVGDENSTFVSVDGDDNNIGSADSPVATIAKAVEIAKNRTGEIIITEGTYTESGIELDSNVAWSITGVGNVVIDGNASSNSIFILHGGAATVTNVKFRNNKPTYGGAILINYGTGTSSTVIDINVTVDSCTFENIESSKRGGSIYAHYTKGNLIVKNSHFINSTADTWGGAICVSYSIRGGGLNVVINGSTFEDCSANNGGACYLQAKTLTVIDSVFECNNATADSGAMYIYNSTATIDNCIISNNGAGSQGVAIKESTPSGYIPTLTITNSVIENNTGVSSTLPAIYVDMATLDVSYSSLVNDLSIETRTATGYSAVYGQGIATVNNNWWGTNDPSSKVSGTNITMDNWVIMNVVANVTEAIPGDKVGLTVDFNHVNTTAGEIEELTGGAIPKAYKVQLSSNDGTIVPSTLTIRDGETKNAVYTVGALYDVVSVVSEEALVEMTFVPEVPPYYGIIYVSKDGNDNNNGSEEAPVATIAKAVELATLVGGSHQIVIDEGTYKPDASITITDDLTITGNGAVVIDADGMEKLIDLPYSSPVKGFTVVLNNLALINGNGNQYGTVYNYADAYLFLNNVNISDCTGSYLGGIISTTGNTTITDSVISDCTAGRIVYMSVGYNKPITVTIVNSTLKDNVAFIDDGSDLGAGYALIDISTTTKNTVLNLIDSHIIGNTGELGTVYTTSDKATINVNGTEFVDNTVLVGNGGAINGYNMVINNSAFINNAVINTQGRDGGAINIARLGKAVITNSKFEDNSATGRGNTIYNGWELTINNCAIIDNTQGNVIYHNGEDNVMDAKYNWWGTNDDPAALIGTGTYEDDYGYGYEDCEYDAGKWVVMNVVNNYTGEPLAIGDEVEFTVDFNHYATDSSGTIYELPGSIPEVEVSASAIKGAFDNEKTTTENGVATFIYTADIGGEDTINITSSKAVDTTVVDIIEPIVVEVVYVGPNGNDSNVGYYDEPIATIAHAIEIAERGKIVIFEGTYTLNATLVIDKDLDIRGEGTVIIDGNLNRIIENSANLNLTNIQFTNGKAGYGAVILDNGNMTIDGCSFYGNNATGNSGSAIHNLKGSMTVNDTKFYNNIVAKGAISSQTGTNLVVNNSEFYDNDMTLISTFMSSTNSNGMIYLNSADAIVENTVFRNNKAKHGVGIWVTRATSATTGSVKVINCTFENNTAVVGSAGAIYTNGKAEANVVNSTFINNTASGYTYGGGAIYTTGTSKMTISNSVFIDNYGINYNDVEDSGIYVGATGSSSSSLTISNSVIIPREDSTAFAVYAADGAIVTAENNFWGDNSKANTNANVDKWVIMSATYDNETGALDITFDKTNSTAGVADYDGVLPDGFTVTVSSSSGALDETLPIIAGQASTNYFTRVSENITVKSGNAEVVIEVIVIPKVVYVGKDGDDNNTGSRDDPVATIAKAIELADEGRIVILPGTYTTGDLGIISSDLNITGEGTVIIDAQNANRILYVGSDANVVLRNLIMINGASDVDSGALLGNSNYLTLINCTLTNSSAGEHNGGAIYNAGKLTIINSTIANNTARVGGAIFNQYSGTELVIINSTFENNVANGDDNNGGGAIFAQQLSGLTIINSSFIANEALTTSSGGAIGIIFAEADYTITDSTFMDNHANGKESTGGGAIYIAGTSNYQRSGSLTITNSLFEGNTADNDGAAIYARATTLDVSNSVIFANKDPAGYAVFGYKTDQVAPAITLNDNWWGSNDDPSDYVGGYNYKPTVSRWVILTATNDTPFTEGNTVKITVSLDKYTDGENIGDLTTPITIPRDVFIETSFDTIEGVMENGEFTIDYVVPADLRYVEAIVDTGSVLLYKVKYETVIEAVPVSDEKGNTVAINTTVKTTEGDAVGYAAVIASVADGENSTYYADENGNVVIPISGLAPGNYSASIVFEENYDYLGSSAVVDVVINKINTTVVAVAVVGDNDDVVAVNVTVSTVDGTSVGVVPVDVTIGAGEAVTYETDVNGNVVVPVSGLAPGSYVASIVFDGDDTYAGSDASVDVVINKINTTVVAVAVVGDNDDVVAVNVTVSTVDGASVGVVPVDVAIGTGEAVTYYTDADGNVVVPVSGLAPGSYVASIVFAGDDTYVGSDDSVDVVINKINTTLTANDVVAVYNVSSVLNVTLKDVNGNAIGDVLVNIVLGSINETLTTDDYGSVSVSTISLVPGKYTAMISYDGSDIYVGSSTEVNVSVAKIDTCISAPNVDVIYRDQSGELIATLTDAYGNPLAGCDVVVSLNGADYELETDSNGQVNVSTSSLTPKKYSAVVYYAGDDYYSPSSVTAKVVVTKADTNISAIDDGEKIIATLTNAYGTPLNSANVIINIAGTDYALKTNSKGQAKLLKSELEIGTYTAFISYAGNNKYNPSDATVNVTVKSESILVSQDVYVAYRDQSGVLTATLTDVNGNPLADCDVIVSLNGVDYALKTDSNGQVNVSTSSLTPKKYSAVISFAGNDDYYSASVTAKVVVNKASTSISAIDNGEELVATLTNGYGTPLNSANVVVNLNGVDYALKTNSKGQVKVSTADLDPKSYTATVSYAGNNKYNPATTTIKVAEGKATTSISTAYNKETGELITTLTNTATGNGIKGAKVVVKINGVKNSLTTDSNGQVIIPTEGFDPDTYTIISSYSGNAKYTATSTTETILIA